MKRADHVAASCRARAGAKAAVVLALLGAAAVSALAQTGGLPETIVGDIIITGNRNVSNYTILSKMKTRVGRPYDPAVLKEDITGLYLTGTIARIEPKTYTTPDGRFIIELHVQEPPSLVQDIKYKNSRHLKPEDIDALKLIRKGSPLNPDVCRRAIHEITTYYQEKGYYFVHVDLEKGGNPGDSEVVFNISEGPVVRVRSTHFVGNESLATQARLRTQIETSRKFLGLPIGGTFVPDKVNGDVLKLQEYYRNNGYMDVTVSRELTFSEDLKNVDVIFVIREGQRYRVQDIGVKGAKSLPEAQIKSIVQVKHGEYFNETTVATDKRNIQDLYGWRGYAVNTKPELFFPEPGLVNVVYQIQEEQPRPARVGEVIITGNTVTKDRVIRRVLGLYPGQTLEYPQLRIAEQNLARLGIFETSPEKGMRPTVMIDPNSPPDSDIKDILVHVDETATGSFQLGVGVNSDSGLVGNIVLNERNFDILRPPTSLSDLFSGHAWRGGGQEFRIEASPGTQVQRYTVSWREPYLFDLPYSLGISAYYWDRIYSEDTETRVGTRFVLGHQLNRYWSVAGAVRVEGIGIHDLGPTAPPDYTSVQGENFLVAPRISVTRDSRDSFLKPTQGSVIEAAFEEGLGSFTFPVVSLDAQKFFTTFQRNDGSGKQVLALRSRVSWAGSNTPVYERFYGGGFTTLRGFAFRGVGPEINGYRVGGDFMFLNSVEYQIPIMANDHLYFVTFVDSGTVESTPGIHNYRVSAGFGLRIIVPMMGPVPIALDFGFPLIKSPDDQQQIFSFYVGLFRY
jgi:outer membrane protein assembly complex protein YaeT